jgi:uncharacterized membrane protein YraQ (UPF0718 family)
MPATDEKRPRRRMLTSILLLGGLVLITAAFAYSRGGIGAPVEGARIGLSLLLDVSPQLFLGFLLAGMVTVILPSETLGRFVGEESGFGGVAIGAVAGMATPGGPFLQFPLVATLVGGGAGVGPVAAYLTAWSLISWQRILVWELPILGGPFTIARLVVSVLLPLVVGIFMPPVLRIVTRLAGA